MSESANKTLPKDVKQFVRVPLRMTRAMMEVVEQEEWQWEDLLAAAEAITEEQYLMLQSEPAQEPQNDGLVPAATGTEVHPCAPGLPEIAYLDNKDQVNGKSPIIAVRRGEMGFYPIFTPRSADELNEALGVTPAQREAMYNGSLFGWNTPAADPNNPIVIRSAAVRTSPG